MPVTAEQTLPQLNFALTEKLYTHLIKKKKNPHTRTLCHTIAFVKALSILSLGPLILLPKLANGS